MKADAGLYLKAFCEGLFQSLEPYRQDLKNLETQFFNGPHSTSITTVLYTFEKHHPLLEFMVKIIREVSLIGAYEHPTIHYQVDLTGTPEQVRLSGLPDSGQP
jgi:Spc97 / Spc98 family.